MSKETIEKYVSPKGVLNWVTITGDGVENMSGKLQYKADLNIGNVDGPKAKDLIAKIDAYWDKHKPADLKRKPKSLGYSFCTPLLDADGNHQEDEEGKKLYDPKGDIAINFKTGTTFPDGKTKKVKVRNAKGAEVNLGDTKIGNGSEGYIAGAMDIYIVKTPKGQISGAGVTFYLDEIKLTKLVEFGGADPFGDTGTDDEDGWTGEEQDAFVGSDESEESKPRL